MISFDISGRVAVITGGYGVLCSAMAREMAKAGARIAILGRDEEKAKKLADSITARAGKQSV